jgi:hypothetical protein
VRISWVGPGGLEDSSDGAFAIRYRNPLPGLVWIPRSGFEEVEVRGAIAAATLYENDFDWTLSKAVTATDLSSALAGLDAFLMPQQAPDDEVNFKALGRALGPVLREFVDRGGTAVVLKQAGRAREFLPAAGLLEAEETGSGFNVPVKLALPDHPVTNGLEAEFRSASSTAWYEFGDEGAQIYATTLEGRAVAAGKDRGDGRVVLIGFDYRDYTRDSARLLANALRNVRAVERARFVRGDANADGVVDISDVLFILSYLFLGGLEPPCLDAADVNDSAEPGQLFFAIDLNDPIRLLNWLFLGNSSLPSPAPLALRDVRSSCGPDPQFRDELDCSSYPPCGGGADLPRNP